MNNMKKKFKTVSEAIQENSEKLNTAAIKNIEDSEEMKGLLQQVNNLNDLLTKFKDDPVKLTMLKNTFIRMGEYELAAKARSRYRELTYKPEVENHRTEIEMFKSYLAAAGLHANDMEIFILKEVFNLTYESIKTMKEIPVSKLQAVRLEAKRLFTENY